MTTRSSIRKPRVTIAPKKSKKDLIGEEDEEENSDRGASPLTNTLVLQDLQVDRGVSPANNTFILQDLPAVSRVSRVSQSLPERFSLTPMTKLEVSKGSDTEGDLDLVEQNILLSGELDTALDRLDALESAYNRLLSSNTNHEPAYDEHDNTEATTRNEVAKQSATQLFRNEPKWLRF